MEAVGNGQRIEQHLKMKIEVSRKSTTTKTVINKFKGANPFNRGKHYEGRSAH